MFRPDHSFVPVFGPGDESVRELHSAVYEGNLAGVQRCVLTNGVNPNAQLGHSVPLGLAVARGHNDICRFLVEQSADVNFAGKSGRLPLYLAAKLGNTDVVQLLLKNKADLSLPFITGNTPLLTAANEGHLDIARVLLEAGSEPLTVNNSGSTGLHLAAYQRNVPLIKMFLEAGVNVNMLQNRRRKVLLSTDGHRGTTPLHLAAASPEEDEEGRSFVSVCNETLTVLLDAGADVNASMENGRTALHLAASKNCTTIAKILIQHGCQIDPISTENDEQKTPLHRAVDLGHVDVARVLIDAGADVNFRDHWGVTPLFTAVFSNSLPITKLLIQAGSDVNTSTNNSSTLFLASLRHEPIITQMLLLGGCHGSLLDYQQLSWKQPGENRNLSDLHEWILYFLTNPRTLQQQCREVIRGHVVPRPAHCVIEQLPVPKKIELYLNLTELDAL